MIKIRSYDEILDIMKSEFTEKAGFSPDDASDIGIRLKVLASQIYSLGVHQDWLKRQAFPQTATGEELDKHAEMRGLERKKAYKATGKVTFYSAYPTSYDIDIPAGIVCCTREEPKLRFVTTSPGVMLSGTNYVTVDAEAEEGGGQYNVATGTITEIVTSVEGVAAVRNGAVFTGGKDAESDEKLRSRIMQSYSVINGTNVDTYKKEVLKVDGVRSVNVFKYPRGLGSLDIYVMGEWEPLDAAKLSEIRTRLNMIREVSVDLEVKNASIYEYDIEVDLEIDNKYDADEAKAKVKKAIEDYFRNLEVGAPVLINQLGKAILAVEGVVDYNFIDMVNAPGYPYGCYVPGDVFVH